MNSSKLAQAVKRANELHLDVFFTAKTHKPSIPFRVIITERDTWQYCVSGFLQNCLSAVHMEDHFLVPNSLAVAEYLNTHTLSDTPAISIDVDLFYSLPHVPLLPAVKECITLENDEMAFKHASGITVPSFKELLCFYLNSSVIVYHDGEVLAQKFGVCIGSRVAPILNNTFLAKVDRFLEKDFSRMVKKVFRYVDDYFVIFDTASSLRSTVDILKVFKEMGLGLNFMVETLK